MDNLQHRILMLSGWRRFGLALVAGALTALAQAPFHLFIIGFATFPVLVWLLDGAVGLTGKGNRRSMRPAFVIGWGFGFGYFIAGLWWIANALLVEARDFAWFIPLAVLGLPALLALFHGVAAVVARMFWSEGIGRIATVAATFGFAEWARGIVATGFPWNAFGYAIMPTPMLMQSASVLGIASMSVLAVFVFSLPAAFAGPRRRAVFASILLIGLLGAHAGYGYWRLDQAGPVAGEAAEDTKIIRIVQPAISQSEKWDNEERVRILETLFDLTRQASDDGVLPDIIVWPETALPVILTQAPEVVSAIAETLEDGQVLVTGAVRTEGDVPEGQAPTYYNSMLVIDSDGVITDAADKVHLVPFGEYLPLKDLLGSIGMKKVADADRGYAPASGRKLLDVAGIRTLPLICYEILFDRHATPDALTTGLIINVTNDAWYGDTPGPRQHLHQARLRAVETGVPLVRAANNGISGIYDSYGRPVVAPLGYDVQGAVQASIPAKAATTLYGRNFLFNPWLILVFFMLWGIIGSRSGAIKAV